MLWYTREADGETVFTNLGCLLLILFFPIALIFFLLKAAFTDDLPPSRKQVTKATWLGRTEHKYFLRVSGVDPQWFWLQQLEYQRMEIPKPSGGVRRLDIPCESLKTLQKKIADFVARHHPSGVHKCANGFIKGRNTLTNAIPHLGCAVLIKLDVKNFFEQISEELVAEELLRSVNGNQKLAERITELVTHNGGLPQGAPSSPLLSNLVMHDFDRAMYRLSNLLGARYTRYADDITLSLAADDRQKINYLIHSVEKRLTDMGLSLNQKRGKKQILRPHQAQRVCGITLNSGRPTISRKQRRLLRAIKHRHGHTGEASMSAEQIAGWDAYLRGIEQQPV